jgi:hypothetical protein
MEDKEKFLPIGTVVLLKGGKKELMITSYCVFPQGEVIEKGKKVETPDGKYYEYGACTYPEGLISSEQIFCFNHDKISKVCYMGYETDAQKQLSGLINEGIEAYNQSLQESEA